MQTRVRGPFHSQGTRWDPKEATSWEDSRNFWPSMTTRYPPSCGPWSGMSLVTAGSERGSFSADDRVAVYSALVDMCSMAKQLTNLARSKHARLRSALGEYHEAQTPLTSSAPLLQPTRGTVNKCHFTGISMRNTFEALRWSAVPPEYEVLPVVLELQAAVKGAAGPAGESRAVAESSTSYQFRNQRASVGSTGAGGGETQLVAVQTALLRVVAAREAATREKSKYGVCFGLLIEFQIAITPGFVGIHRHPVGRTHETCAALSIHRRGGFLAAAGVPLPARRIRSVSII